MSAFNPGEGLLHRGFMLSRKDLGNDRPNRFHRNEFGKLSSAVKNCYPGQKRRASPMEDASAEFNEAPPQRTVLIVVNKQCSDGFDTLFQPLV